MQKPIIIQFESDPFYVAAADLILFQAGFELADKAHDITSTKQLLEKIKSGKLKPDIAIIDTQIQNNHFEGEKIATRIKEASSNTKIIAYTIMDDVTWADYLALKSNLDPEQTLVKALSAALSVEILKSQ